MAALSLEEKMAKDSYPASYTKPIDGGDSFVAPGHPQFEEVMQTSYRGFERTPAAELMPKFTASLQQLEGGGAFQYDVTQPMGIGTPCAKTKVGARARTAARAATVPPTASRAPTPHNHHSRSPRWCR